MQPHVMLTHSTEKLRAKMNEIHEEMDISGVKIAIVDDAKTIRMMMSHQINNF